MTIKYNLKFISSDAAIFTYFKLGQFQKYYFNKSLYKMQYSKFKC